MNDEQMSEEQGREPQEKRSGWLAFQEKPVMLQLREPYIGVTYAYGPAKDEGSGGVRATPVLSGVLHVEPDGAGGIMLVIQMSTGSGNDFALIAVRPEDVLFATHIHQARIVAQ